MHTPPCPWATHQQLLFEAQQLCHSGLHLRLHFRGLLDALLGLGKGGLGFRV
jgi:hypothetical protein